MDLVGTNVATGSTQEDTYDPGYRYEDRIGVRMWRIEEMIGDIADSFTPQVNAVSAIILTTRNETAIPEPNADGVIFAYKENVVVGSTAGTSPIRHKFVWGRQFYPKGLLTVTDRYYLWFQNAVGATRKARLRVWYTTEDLTDADYREFFEIWARA